MPDTLIFGIITFLVVLGPLIIFHELGHFFTAKLNKVKVTEFGFGFPPRAFGLWTGRTLVGMDGATVVDLPRGADDLRPGRQLTIRTRRLPDGRLMAAHVGPDAGPQDDESARPDDAGPLVSGKLRRIDNGEMAVSEMVWSFNYLPLGGFVKMVGEEDPRAEGSLASKSRLARAVVISSGAAVNALLPFIIFPLVFMIPQDVLVGDVTLTGVMPGSPAAEAGLRPGDVVRTVDGRTVENTADLQQAVTLRLGAESTWEVSRGIPVPSPQPGEPPFQYGPGTETVTLIPRWSPPRREVVAEVSDPATQVSLGQARAHDPRVGLSNSLTVVESATDPLHEISLADARAINPDMQLGAVLRVVQQATDPRTQISLEDARQHDSRLGLATHLQEGAVGITIATANAAVESRTLPPWRAVPEGFKAVIDVIVLTRNAIAGMVGGSNNPQFEGPAAVGPIGIGQLTGEIATADTDLATRIVTLARLAGVLSISLAVINILPIPALDGGRLLFVVIEWARGGKRIPPEREGLVHLAGMVLLLTLIALISMQDILRIFRGERFF